LATQQLPPSAHKALAAARQCLAHQRALNQGQQHEAQRTACRIQSISTRAVTSSGSAAAATSATTAQPASGSGAGGAPTQQAEPPPQGNSPGSSRYGDLQLRLEARRRVLQNLLAAGDLEGAAREAGAAWAEAAAASLHNEAVRGLLALAQVHRQAGHPVGAFPYVLSALLQVGPPGRGRCLAVLPCWRRAAGPLAHLAHALAVRSASGGGRELRQQAALPPPPPPARALPPAALCQPPPCGQSSRPPVPLAPRPGRRRPAAWTCWQRRPQ
jgi:hypothetical protein